MGTVKYRQYKNGIFGYKYRKYYIRYDRENGVFEALNPALKKIAGPVPDRLEAQQSILMEEAKTHPDVNIEEITELPFFKLNALAVKLANKHDEFSLTADEQYAFDLAVNLIEQRTEKMIKKKG